MKKIILAVVVGLVSSSAFAGELRVTLSTDTKTPAFCDKYSITATGGGNTYTSRSKTLTGNFPSSTKVEVKATASGCKNGKDGSTTRTVKMGQDGTDAKVHIVF